MPDAAAPEEPFRPRKRAGAWWRELRRRSPGPRPALGLPLLALAATLFAFHRLFVALRAVKPAGQGGAAPLDAAAPALAWLLLATAGMGLLAFTLGASRSPTVTVKPGEGRLLALDALRGVRDLLRGPRR